ncbi:hypothetical protein CORC01_07129 [Colletotrichum orchidophilum]|uniref:Uncharacterized protein n=1 Tax=Colletotrichum orchidophilum TaxID=1209926 RepID=A0A1G4B803_9PEZI|nr:uncharacterized protein CORC01_07129 [Colletotrichum orchidophilum]OHE97514.1 hypothetical protein CORC01_07129 [Colletotrichum orchidophilum]
MRFTLTIRGVEQRYKRASADQRAQSHSPATNGPITISDMAIELVAYAQWVKLHTWLRNSMLELPDATGRHPQRTVEYAVGSAKHELLSRSPLPSASFRWILDDGGGR